MLYNQILIRFGDLTLKGKNQVFFLRKLYNQISFKLEGLNVNIINNRDRVYIDIVDEDINEIIKRLNTISGIYSYSLVVKVKDDIELIKEKSLELMNEILNNEKKTFKVNTKRANKDYPLHSMEVNKIISSHILRNVNDLLTVDVHTPNISLNIELRGGYAYIFNDTIKGIGGFPVGTLGKGLLMLSGGIDSPVAAYLAMKQGIEVECLHFESSPLTSIEAANKVVDLCERLTPYTSNYKIKLHMVPFKDVHMKLLEVVEDSYIITIMRRMMFRIASKFAQTHDCLAIITGESVGQVASQTLESMVTINNVTNYPVLRPLVTYDKEDIITISKKIDCFDVSIRPFSDCCTVYVPKNPATKPKVYKAEYNESKADFETLVDEAVKNTKTIIIKKGDKIDLSLYGLEVREAIDLYMNDNKNN